MILHGLHGGIIKWIWQFRWLQVRYKRLMYRYLLGFCVRVFLVRVLSHLTLCSTFSFLLHSCALGKSLSMRGDSHGAWGMELPVPDYRAVYATGVEGGKEPRELLVWGFVLALPVSRSVAKARWVSRTALWWVWHWLQGAAPICF